MGYKHQHLGWQPGLAAFFIDRTMHPEFWHKHIAIYSSRLNKAMTITACQANTRALSAWCRESAMIANMAIEKANQQSRLR